MTTFDQCAADYAKGVGMGMSIAFIIIGVLTPGICWAIPWCRTDEKRPFLIGACVFGACLTISGAVVLGVYLSNPVGFYDNLPG
jgi:hypothetical protein